MKFKTEIKSELNRTMLRIYGNGFYKQDYQTTMMQMNPIKGLLPIMVKGEGADTVYEYEITGLTSVRTYYSQKKITAEEMERFLHQIQETVQSVEQYLLNPNRLLLDPDVIFRKDETYYFCYLPQEEAQIRQSFHALMEEFVQWTDYQDMESVKMAFLLHKETMKENYSLNGILEAIDQLKKTEKKEETEMPDMQRELWENGTYDREEHDWITKQEHGSKILKETDNLWSPVKRLLNRHKRPRWGDWDGIYIDEEEL